MGTSKSWIALPGPAVSGCCYKLPYNNSSTHNSNTDRRNKYEYMVIIIVILEIQIHIFRITVLVIAIIVVVILTFSHEIPYYFCPCIVLPQLKPTKLRSRK